jgi:hypothetical protein
MFELGHDGFLPNPSQTFIHQSFLHSMITKPRQILRATLNTPQKKTEYSTVLATIYKTTASSKIRVRARVTLRLAVYRQSFLLGDKPLQTHDQHLF